MKSTRDHAQEIRDELKIKGWNSRKVSVRVHSYSGGSSIYVTVRDPAVPFAEVKEIAERCQVIRRCEVTGEILSGGNRFVFTEMTDKVRDALAAPYVEAVRKAVESAKTASESTITPVEGTDAGVSKHGCGFQLWLGLSEPGSNVKLHHASGPAALDIALHEQKAGRKAGRKPEPKKPEPMTRDDLVNAMKAALGSLPQSPHHAATILCEAIDEAIDNA